MGDRQIRFMKVMLLVCSLACLGLLVLAAYREHFRGDWRSAQASYKAALISAATDDAALRSAQGMQLQQQQLYLPELGTIDRCTTCHLGVENPAMVDADAPLTRHPGTLLSQHPVEKFGCTICHQGEGRAVTKAAAHGWHSDGRPVPKMDTPMLRGQAVYTSCGKCHSELDLYGGETDLFASSDDSGEPRAKPRITEASLARALPGADRLANGKRLTSTAGCLGCHKYRGRGGTLGPELTYVGDKTKHDFDFTHVKGEHTVEQWLFEHFKYPKEISPATVMPDLRLADQEARDLALYMMSLHRKTAPARLMPKLSAVADSGTTPNDAVLDSSAHAVRGETLYKMFCAACHGAEGYGTTMRAGLWPTDADPWGRDWDVRSVVVEQRGDMDVLVPSLHHADTLAVASDAYMRRIIAGGRPGTKMLAWTDEGGLTDDEITLIVGFIRGWDHPLPNIAAVSADAGNPQFGAALYRANCAACHGRNGEGAIGNSLNSPTFLAVASDAFLRDTIIHGRPDTAMPAWREFDSRELSDLLAFIRQWQPANSTPERSLALCDGTETADVSVSIGRTIFAANCITCHGRDGAGDLGPSLNTQSFLTVVPDSYLVKTLIDGRSGTGMPSWRHFSDDDIASLVRFMRTWQTEPSRPAEWHEQRVPRGDWDTGERLFAGQCAACHGPDGEGATGPQLNNPMFLGLASNVMLREWISYGKEGTEMRSFLKGKQGVAELSERQIDDIVAYLRQFERTSEDELVRVSKSPNGRPQLGAMVYAVHCIACHGPNGEGASGPALSNTGFLRLASDGFLMATLAMGRSGTEMRPVKRGPQSILNLTSDEVNDLVAYLRSWESAPPFDNRTTAHRFVVPWDFARGQELFVSNCAGCHGVEGKGSWAPELNNEGFLAAATDGFLQATIIRGRTGTAMRPFGRGSNGLGDLTPDDVDDIVAYMRRWSVAAPSPMTIPAEHSLEYAPDADSVTQHSTPADSPNHEATRTDPSSLATNGRRIQGD